MLSPVVLKKRCGKLTTKRVPLGKFRALLAAAAGLAVGTGLVGGDEDPGDAEIVTVGEALGTSGLELLGAVVGLLGVMGLVGPGLQAMNKLREHAVKREKFK